MTDPFDRPAHPLDLYNKALGRVGAEVAAQRMAICRECPFFNSIGQCTECHCFMALKTKLPNASCPQHKWGQVRVLDTPPQKVLVIVDGVVQDILNADDRMTALLLSNPTFVGVPLDTTMKVGDTYGG
jgi:hypothetical protein